ncbi:penicillin-binding transpeptidase domain protein [Bacillus clarus]|uniref:Penicillin-binding transpeptidase domain protein n=1 Tax=Bacillus clarus TaxID=2338372 RepID=A0A090YB44_9BACI|nr:penicillin-binding transpeptidase domain protein [Bacillus clarus]
MTFQIIKRDMPEKEYAMVSENLSEFPSVDTAID